MKGGVTKQKYPLLSNADSFMFIIIRDLFYQYHQNTLHPDHWLYVTSNMLLAET